jgi:uncharacterized protein involved in exopolysaccharide biosynthesis
VTDSESLSLREAGAILWRRRWLIVGTTVAGLLAAIALTLITTPMYRVKATLVPAESGTDGLFGSLLGSFGGGLPGMMGMGGLTQDYTTEALALFESRQFIQQFIRDENLLPKLFKKDWDAAKGAWRVPPEKAPTLWKSYDRFTDRFRAFKNRKSGLVTVEMEWPDRQEAARLVNTIVARVNQDMRGRAMQEATLAIEYLQQEVADARSVELQKTIYGMIENQIKLKAVASARQQFAFKVLDPALPPDEDDKIQPKPVLYVAGGTVLGGMLGIVVALIMGMGSAPLGQADPRRAPGERLALDA